MIVEDEPKTSIVSGIDLQINGLLRCSRSFRHEIAHQADVGEGACVEPEAQNSTSLFSFLCVEVLNDI